VCMSPSARLNAGARKDTSSGNARRSRMDPPRRCGRLGRCGRDGFDVPGIARPGPRRRCQDRDPFGTAMFDRRQGFGPAAKGRPRSKEV